MVELACFQQVRAHVPVPGADLAAVTGQQLRHEHDELERDVKED